MTSIDSFSRYTRRYDPMDLFLASNMRGSLKLNPPPFELSQRKDGTIRLEKVLRKFELSTGIQEDYQLLQLQGKDVSEYKGGIDAMNRVLQQNRRIELIALKPSARQQNIAEKKNKKKKASKATETYILRSLPKKSKKKTKKKDAATKSSIQELREKHNYGELLWACGTKRSLQQSAPFRLRQHKSGAIRMHYVDPKFQQATGIQRGHRLVQLQGKDINSYQNFEEVQKSIQESLEIHVVVLKRSVKPQNRTSNSKRSFPSDTKKPNTSRPSSVSRERSSSSRRKRFSFSSFSSSRSENSSSRQRPLGTRFGWLKSKLLAQRSKSESTT